MLLNAYVLLVLLAVTLATAMTGLARWLNLRHLSPLVPPAFIRILSQDEYAKSVCYQRASSVKDEFQELLYFILLMVFILLGGLGWLDRLARSLGQGELITGLIFIGLAGLGQWGVNLPFEIYQTFGLEARFGFNKTTAWIFTTDRLKGMVLTVILGGLLLGAVLWAYQHLGAWAWLAAWAVIAAFSALMLYLGPLIILPLFNKFRPLEPGPLRAAIEDYALGQGFKTSGIFVMDGSKRSSKANAFVTGWGKSKRISLYDTLLDNLSLDEVVAVLAHEVGHAKHGHLLKGYVLGMLKIGFSLYALQLFLGAWGLQLAFGVTKPSVQAGLLIFGLVFEPLALALGVWANYCSRKWEYQADAYAANGPGGPRALVLALVSLTKANYANLTPHPLWVWLNASHPPVLERISRLQGKDPRPYEPLEQAG